MKSSESKNHRDQDKRRCTFQMPAIPKTEWCDFRKDYESGMTLIEIAEKYFCDPRTVKSCIVHNKPSNMLGKQSVPTRLSPYCGYIDDYLTKSETIQALQQSHLNISALTRDIFHTLQIQGYTGCERTVRNYICSKLPSRKVQKKRRN